MKTTKKIISFTFFVLNGIFTPVSAQGNQIVDLLNNQHFNYTTQYFKLEENKQTIFPDMDLEYPKLTGLQDSLIQKKLNKRFKQIMIDQLETDSFRIKLVANLKQSLFTYFTIYNKLKDQLGIYDESKFKFTPDLKEIDFSFSPCFKSVTAFVVSFKYTTQYHTYLIDEDFNYFQTYYFNLSTGKEYRASDVFNKSASKSISDLVEKAVKKNAAEYKVKLDFSISSSTDESEEEGTEKGEKERSLVGFSLTTDGFPFLMAFSMAYYIPAWTPCTQNIYGFDQEIRFTFKELKTLLNPNGPFAGLINYSLPQSSLLHNQNWPVAQNQNSFSIPQFTGYEFFPLHISGNIKTLFLKQLVKTKNKEGN